MTLTVSDLDHATGTLTKTVTVSTLPAAFVSDTFQRTVASGWGSADVGGAWTVSGPAGATAVTPGRATMRLAAGAQAIAYLSAVTRSDSDVTTSFAVDAVPAGGPVYVTVTGRRVSGGNEYSTKVLVNADASVTIRLIKVVAGTETAIAGPVKVPGLTYTAGAAIAVRLQVTGTSPTTLRARAWAAAGTEPSTWNVSLVDSSAGLQAAGGVQLVTYVSRTVTNGPLTTGFGALAARPTSG